MILDIIRFNYIYSFSFKNFGIDGSSSLSNFKPITFFLGSNTRNTEISVRSSIKHEFKLSDFQRSEVSKYIVIPSRKDDEFGKPYFKPFIFKYNFYWDFYDRKSFFFSNNHINLFTFSNIFDFDVPPNISADTCSFISFRSFPKRFFLSNFSCRYRFKKKYQDSLSRSLLYFKFRSNGMFFSYKPFQSIFFFNKSFYTYKFYNNFFFKIFMKSKVNTKVINNFSINFFLVEKRFSVLFKKRVFEYYKTFPTTYFYNKISTFYFSKFTKFFKSGLYLNKQRKIDFFLKNIVFVFKKKFSNFIKFENFFRRYKTAKNIFFFNKIKKKDIYTSKNNNNFFNIKYNSIPNHITFIIYFFRTFFLNRLNYNIKKFNIKFLNIIIKKFKNVKKFLINFFSFFKFKHVKISKLFFSIYFFNLFFKIFRNKITFKDINIFKCYFSYLVILNKISIFNFIKNDNFYSTFINSILLSFFFKIKNIKSTHLFYRDFSFSESTKFFNFTNFINNNIFLTKNKINFKFIYFNDFYNVFFNNYNNFSSNRYNDSFKFHKDIFTKDFYSYRVSSSRKTNKLRSTFFIKKTGLPFFFD
jgi:hypothetical protein